MDKKLQDISTDKTRHQLLIAGAGAGKTHTLIEVLAERIRNKSLDPLDKNQRIIVFTFTNSAADELTVRLSQKLNDQKETINKLFIGTIHGWCNEYLHDREYLANTKVMGELEQLQLLQRIYPIIGIEKAYNGRNKFVKIEQFIQDLEIFFSENLEINDKRIPNNARTVIQNYLTFLDRERLVDFGLLIRRSIKALVEKTGGIIYHVYVDEYQDVNNAQVCLIQALLAHKKSTLFAVGDPRQAIYQWRGSDIERILKFSDDFSDTKVYNLSTNRRSREGIVEYANIISKDMKLGANYEISPMSIYEKRKDNKNSVILDISSSKHEEAVVNLIKRLTKQGVKHSDICILMRSVISNGKDLMELLSKEKIPFYSPNQNKGIEFVNDFMLSIIELMIFMKGFHPHNQDEEREAEEKIQSLLSNIKKYSIKNVQDIHKCVAEWFKELDIPQRDSKYFTTKIYANEQYNFRKQLFDFTSKIGFSIKESDWSIQEGFASITQIMKAIEEIYRRRFSKGSNTRETPLEVFTQNLKWHIQEEIERWYETGMSLHENNEVTISTVHAAKGLEWPVIIVPGLWKHKFPLRQSKYETSFEGDFALKYGTTIEDEKRLWYVAVTRARDNLFILAGGDEKHKTSPFVYAQEVFDKSNIKVTSTDKAEKLSEVESCKKELYLKIGVSNFLLMLECPYHFYLRYIAGVDVPVGKELGAGDIIHKVISRTMREGENKVEDIIKEEVYLPLGEIEDQIIVKNSIQKKVKDLIKSNLLNEIEEIEYPFTININNMIVIGIVDASRRTQRGIEIIDWKSNIHDKFSHRYINQILVYARGLKELGKKVSNGQIYDLSNPQIKGQKFEVNDTDIKKLFNRADNIINDINQQKIMATPNKISCKVCDVTNICPKNCYQK